MRWKKKNNEQSSIFLILDNEKIILVILYNFVLLFCYLKNSLYLSYLRSERSAPKETVHSAINE